MWFMVDRHRDDIDTIRGLFRTGDYGAYLNYLNGHIGSTYDHEWRRWIKKVLNRSPDVAEPLPYVELAGVGSTRQVDVSRAFVDPDGDALSYSASSSKPYVATARLSGTSVTLTAVAAGSATVDVKATDPKGLTAAQSFGVGVTVEFTDDRIEAGVTSVRAVHFTELRARIDVLRRSAGLGRFGWTDPVLTAGVTRVRRVHLLELRRALRAVYVATGRAAPVWTDAALLAGTPIRAVHLMELRTAVVALE